MKLDDLSINLYISLKWIRWGYYFLKSLSKKLDDIKEEYKMNDIISKSIQKIHYNKEENKTIIIDYKEVDNDENFENLLNNVYLNNNPEIYDSNTKIHMKLKLNLREYLVITNMLHPTLIKWQRQV